MNAADCGRLKSPSAWSRSRSEFLFAVTLVMIMNAPLYALNAGEVSKIALARVDVAKLRMAAQCQLNWLPWVVGPMMLRPGMYYVGEVLSDAPAKLLRFVFSKLDTALIELTANQMRVWIDEVLLARPSVGTVIGDATFQGTGAWATTNTTAGATATVTGGVATLAATPVGSLAQIEQQVTVASGDVGKEHCVRIVISNGPVTFRAGSTLGASDLIAQTVLDTGTHSLSCVPTTTALCLQIETTDAWNKSLTGCAIEAAGTVVLPTPWAESDLSNVRYDQSGDIVYIACYGQQQQKIERRGTAPGARGWSVVEYRSSDGPFNDTAGITANFTLGNNYTGNTTLTSDQPWFQPQHVGCLFRLFNNGQYYASILGAQNAYTSPARVSGVASQRDYFWDVSGTWSGTITFQRSYDGADSGFIDVSTITSNAAIKSSTGGPSGVPPLDNVICWERVGFEAGNYTSGTADVTSTYSGGGGYGIGRVTSYVSATEVNIEVLSPFTSPLATTDWVEAQWSGVAGWPTSVCFHEGRLCWFGGDQCWLSASDDYTSFADINLDGTSPGDGRRHQCDARLRSGRYHFLGPVAYPADDRPRAIDRLGALLEFRRAADPERNRDPRLFRPGRAAPAGDQGRQARHLRAAVRRPGL